MSGFGEHLGVIAECVEPTDGLIRVTPEAVTINALRISSMAPKELFYTSGNSVFYDRETLGLMVDANEFIVEFPKTELDVLVNPALMRVWDEVDGEGVDGLLVDYRRVRFPKYRYAGLQNGTDTDVFRKLQEEKGTVLPLAVVSYDTVRGVIYEGPKKLKSRMEELMDETDRRLADVWEILPKYKHAIPVTESEIKRPPKPAPKISTPVGIVEPAAEPVAETGKEVVRYQGTPNVPAVRKGNMLDTLAAGAFYGLVNLITPKQR